MINSDEPILVPRQGIGADCWRITNARLNLARKYGIGEEGPWRPVESNWSVAFDTYALRQGPNRGLPTLADFAVTRLMNSRVGSGDMGRLGLWLSLGINRGKLKAIQDSLKPLQGLHEAGDDAVRQLGNLIDEMMTEQDGKGQRVLSGIAHAKIFKWLSAWAPAHVPMIDSYVEQALTEMEPTSGPLGAGDILMRFRRLLKSNLMPLVELGEWLQEHLLSELPEPLPPVRVLDSLLWCDWWAFWRDGDFKKWVIPRDKNRTDYELTARGKALLARL